VNVQNYLFLIPLLPFLGFLVNGLLGKRIPRKLVGPIACIGPTLAFFIAWAGFQAVRGEGAALPPNALGDWMSVGGVSVGLSFTLDKLSAVMCLVVTGVGTLIHIYSIGYMAEDKSLARFFAYLNLFLAMMLILVLADNLVLMFMGWEGVGLSSYLLIGFWYEDEANAAAGRKAFVVNRIGDFGFILGVFLAYTAFGSFKFADLIATDKLAAIAPGILTAIALLLFVGATGKSAQIPLYVWLPDAMAGPTPVSALIHAATMVTSGVYLVARLFPLYDHAPGALPVVAAVGGATALLAAFIALSQFDIKRVLAYSTVSQLGYMFLALGVGLPAVAIFHLVTHAFFKALLFLGAGAVMHSLHHEQDLRKMGGLQKDIPRTFYVFLAGSLALAGCPPLAGFFSKDAILHGAMSKAFGGSAGWMILWLVGVLTAAMTSFYIFRLVAMAFFGQRFSPKGPEAAPAEAPAAAHGHGHSADPHAAPTHADPHGHGGIHESPPSMMVPLFILAVLSCVGGFLDVPGFLASLSGHEAGHEGGAFAAAAIGTLAFAAGLWTAWWFYLRSTEARARLFARFAAARELFRISSGKVFVDELYDRTVVKPLAGLSAFLFNVVDRIVIDLLLVEGTGGAARGSGKLLRRIQNGRTPSYAAWFAAGAVVVVAVAVYMGVR
jgi:NADH-quinone oxidoreductase subunit L